MKAFFLQLSIQFKNDLRNKGTLLVYYLVPFIFYFIMGSIMDALSEGGGGMSVIDICVLMTASMASFLGLPQALVGARESGVLRAYKVAGLPGWSLPLCNILIVLAHILIVSGVIVLTAPAVFGSAPPRDMGRFLLTAVLVALCSEALGALVAAFVKKQATIGIVGQLLFLPSLMFSGMMIPASLLPEALRTIGSALPAGLGVEVLTAGGGAEANVWVLIIMTAAAFACAGAVYRKRL